MTAGPDFDRKRQAVEALTQVGNPLAELLPLLDDPNAAVRRLVIDAVVATGGQEAADALLSHLSDPDSGVRVDIIEGLGQLGYTHAVEQVVGALRTDPNALVRVCAAEALGDLRVRSPAVVDTLVRTVETDRSPLVRAYAAESLGRLKVEEAAPLLRRRLARERNPRARASMFEALSRLGEARAFQSLLRMLRRVQRPDVRTAILNLLKGLATPQNAPLIAAAVDDIARREPSFSVEHGWFLDYLKAWARPGRRT